MVPLIVTGVMAAAQASSQYSAAKAAVSFNKKQARWNDTNTLRNVRAQAEVLDMNIVRARDETTDVLRATSGAAAEAKALARVQGAAAGINAGGSYSTILNSFSRKENEQSANIMEGLIANLTNSAVQRVQQAFQATTQMSTTQYNNPDWRGYAVNAGAQIANAAISMGYGRSTPNPGDAVSMSGVAPKTFSSISSSPFDIGQRSVVGRNQFLGG